MNLLTIFARIRTAFRVSYTPRIDYNQFSEHLRRDIGLDIPRNQLVDKAPAKNREELVTYGIFTRAP